MRILAVLYERSSTNDIGRMKLASEFAIMSKLTAQKSSLGAAKQNVAAGIAMTKMADSGAGQIQTMIERLKVLATTAASATSSTELAPLEAERVKLEAQITKTAQGLNYNGVKLLDGTGGVQNIQSGTGTAAFDQTTIALNNAYDATTLGLGAAQSATIGTAAAGTFSTQADAQAYITTIDAALSKVITQRADLGSTVNVLNYANNNITTGIEQLTASVSAIRDADIAALTAQKAKLQVQQQAQMSMLVQANQNQQALLSLFR